MRVVGPIAKVVDRPSLPLTVIEVALAAVISPRSKWTVAVVPSRLRTVASPRRTRPTRPAGSTAAREASPAWLGAGWPEEHPDGRGHHHECRDAGE